jgi:CheY-like chemotaxis protein
MLMNEVLYIEDSAVNTYIVKKMLKSLGYPMIPAYDGTEGIALAETRQPSLILIDLILPDCHGLDVVKHLRHMPQFDNTPIIALTATDSPAMKEDCLDAGCIDYLEKPISQARLTSTIEKYLGIPI